MCIISIPLFPILPHQCHYYLLSTFVVCFQGVNAILAVLLNVADVICGKVLVDEG